MKNYWICILASRPRGALYVGMTNEVVDGFTKQYGVKALVYFEQHETAITAIQREKNIKHWSRQWKTDVICSMNLRLDIVR